MSNKSTSESESESCQADCNHHNLPEPSLWNSSLGRRAFLKKTGMASAVTVITLNSLKLEVLASPSTDVLISETRTVPGIVNQSPNTYANEGEALADGRKAAMLALGYASSTNKVYGPKGNMQACFEMSPDPGGASGVTTDPQPGGGFIYTYQIPAGTYTFTYYK